MKQNESLYDIPPGCICLSDGLMGMECPAETHAHFKMSEYACPKCGRDYAIEVLISAWAGLEQSDDGNMETDTSSPDDGSHEWDGASPMKCTECGYYGKSEDFLKSRQEDATLADAIPSTTVRVEHRGEDVYRIHVCNNWADFRYDPKNRTAFYVAGNVDAATGFEGLAAQHIALDVADGK